jgi:hypothetical protein
MALGITKKKIESQFVRISVPEVQFGMCLATQRDACKPNRESRLSTKHSGFGVHFAGVIGELCFHRVYGGKINQSILPQGDQHAADIELPDGRYIEVKTSLYTGPDVELKFESKELEKCEYCCLVQVTLPDSGLVFPIWNLEEIKSKLIKKDYGYGDRWVFRPDSNYESRN